VAFEAQTVIFECSYSLSPSFRPHEMDTRGLFFPSLNVLPPSVPFLVSDPVSPTPPPPPPCPIRILFFPPQARPSPPSGGFFFSGGPPMLSWSSFLPVTKGQRRAVNPPLALYGCRLGEQDNAPCSPSPPPRAYAVGRVEPASSHLARFLCFLSMSCVHTWPTKILPNPSSLLFFYHPQAALQKLLSTGASRGRFF